MKSALALCAAWVVPLAVLRAGDLRLPVTPGMDAQGAATRPPFFVSGIYPHLAISGKLQTEAGISAVVPWAGKLWFIHYFAGEGKQDGVPHLWSVTDDLKLEPHGEYYGGSIASRLILDDAGQLMLGPYLIDQAGGIREFKVYPDMKGKHVSAVARDLKDPNKIHIVGLSNERWCVDISGTNAVVPAGHLVEERSINEISKPVHGFVGAHGKGARCGQGVIVYASNGGGSWPAGAGSLYEWDGVETPVAGQPGYSVDEINRHWKLIRRVQVNEVSGPGGIHGAKDVNEPIWVTGWDHRSVVLMVRDHRTGWHTFRLPKGSHAHGAVHGWYKEWPRIRDVGLGGGRFLMNENGLMYHFPATFEPGRAGGLRPISTFLKMIVDYADWNGRIVMGCNDASAMGNRLCGRVNSNVMFVEKGALTSYGQRPSGFGGVWCNETVRGGQPSDPFLIQGFAHRTLHLRHDAERDIVFTLELDADGSGQWTTCKTLTVPAHGYRYEIIPPDEKAEWVRVRTDADATGASAFFHLENEKVARDPALVQGLAEAGFAGARSDGVIRTHPGESFPLGFAACAIRADGNAADAGYYRVSADMAFEKADDREDDAALRKARPTLDYEVDRASVIVTRAGQRVRLPRGAAAFDQKGPTGWFRGRREVVTERDLMNIHGTFYEVPRDDAGGLRRMRPVTTHNLGIYDFCSWRGMLVCSGVKADPAQLGSHCRAAADGRTALWFGNVDDLWRMGPPAGRGGPWLETAVKAGDASDPYLIFGYLEKVLTLWHDAPGDLQVTLEVDFQADDTWSTYATMTAPAGQRLTHRFPTGYSAHWIRLKVDRACTISAQFDYGPASSPPP